MSDGGEYVHYSREDGCRAWLAYALMPPIKLMRLLQEFGSAETIYTEYVRTGGEVLRPFVRKQGLQELSAHATPEAMHKMMLTLNEHQIGLLSSEDPAYPCLLHEIADPPPLLFYRGNLGCLQERMLTVIGTRSASPQGLQAAHDIAKGLSEAGVVIVSGLAEGIDTEAHTGCLQGRSPTIGICGTGIDVDYPAVNHQLKEDMLAKGGLLLSEWPLGFPALPHSFQHRNRLMSGLSRGTILIESRIKSGAMLTIQHALDQGREVFAWPGYPGSIHAEGAHQLIREGARYFTSAEDILDDMKWTSDALPSSEEKKALPPLSEDQKKVLHALRGGEQSMDQLAAATELSASALSISLTLLQVSGLIRSMPGKTYMII